MKNSIFKLFSMILAIGVIATGCDLTESSVDGPSDVQVQMQVNTSPAAKAMLTSNNEHSNTLEIQEVKLFIEEMELESVNDDSSDFEIEYFIADLPLDGSPLVITEKQIPAGLYKEFELEIEKPDDDDVEVNDTDFRDETGSYSLVVKGLFNGEEFTFKSSEDFEIEMDLNPPLEVTETESSTLVVSVDVTSWFKDSNGEYLDPKDFANTERINETIENSFDGFEDDDGDDGDDDNSNNGSAEFEDQVGSANTSNGTFQLEDGRIFTINSDTNIENDGDLFTLQEVVDEINDGFIVKAEGDYNTEGDTNLVASVKFESNRDD